MKSQLYYLLLLLVFFSCGKDNSAQTHEQRLNENRRLWESQSIIAYQFTQSISCFCIEEFTRAKTLLVQDKVLFSVNGQSNFEEISPNAYLTIEEAFVYIENRLAKDPFDFRIDYHKDYGFPQQFYFDGSEMIADDEIGYSFTSFEVLDRLD
jgi:hypothetical protein